MYNDDFVHLSPIFKDKLKDNIKVDGMYVADVKNDTVYGEINCAHKKPNGGYSGIDMAPYGNHSIDIEFAYDTKKKKMYLSKSN